MGPHLTVVRVKEGRRNHSGDISGRKEFVNYALHFVLHCFKRWPSHSSNPALKLRCTTLLRGKELIAFLFVWYIQNGCIPSLRFKQERVTEANNSHSLIFKGNIWKWKSYCCSKFHIALAFTELESSPQPSHTTCTHPARFYLRCI